MRLSISVLLFLVASLGATAQTADSTAHSTQAEALFVRALTEVFLDDHEQAISLFADILALRPGEPAVLAALSESHLALGQQDEALYYATEAARRSPNPAYLQMLATLQEEAGLAEALATYEQLIDLRPHDTDALRALARLHERERRHNDALEIYRRLQTIEGDHLALLLQMEQLYTQLGEEEEALQLLQAAAKAEPDNYALQMRLARAFHSAGRLTEATSLLALLVEAEPSAAEAVLLLADLYESDGKEKEALALRRGPSAAATPQERLQQATLLYEQAQRDPTATDEARRLLEPLAEEDEAPAEALFLLGALAYDDDDYALAAPVLMRALNKDPRRLDAWEQAAVSFLQNNNAEQAASVAEEGLLLFPGQVALLRTHGHALARLHRPEEALVSLREARAILTEEEPEHHEARAEILATLGAIYDSIDQREQADASFAEARTLAPERPAILDRYAYVLAEREERLSHALELAQAAVAAEPGRALFLDTLGWVYFKLGRHDDAALTLERAISSGGHALAFEHLGDVYHAQGRTAEAQKAWQRARELDPNSAALHRKLRTP